MNDAERFLQYCRLTCLGGSERGTCPCEHPDGCEERGRPGFAAARQEARERMARFFTNSFDESDAADEVLLAVIPASGPGVKGGQ